RLDGEPHVGLGDNAKAVVAPNKVQCRTQDIERDLRVVFRVLRHYVALPVLDGLVTGVATGACSVSASAALRRMLSVRLLSTSPSGRAPLVRGAAAGRCCDACSGYILLFDLFDSFFMSGGVVPDDPAPATPVDSARRRVFQALTKAPILSSGSSGISSCGR